MESHQLILFTHAHFLKEERDNHKMRHQRNKESLLRVRERELHGHDRGSRRKKRR